MMLTQLTSSLEGEMARSRFLSCSPLNPPHRGATDEIPRPAPPLPHTGCNHRSTPTLSLSHRRTLLGLRAKCSQNGYSSTPCRRRGDPPPLVASRVPHRRPPADVVKGKAKPLDSSMPPTSPTAPRDAIGGGFMADARCHALGHPSQ
jgi:hypothetical protein